MESLKEELERMVDEHGVVRIFAMLSELCQDKAEHVRTCWSDEELACRWEKLARRIETTRELPS